MNKFISTSTLFVFWLLLILQSCTPKENNVEVSSDDDAVKSESIKAEIAAQSVLFAKALADGDSVGVADVYTIDAEFMAPNLPLTKGRENIKNVIGGYIREGMVIFNLTDMEILSIDASEEVATVQKAYTLTDKNGGNEDIGKSIEVWKKEDGIFKIYRDCFNSDLPNQ